ncbi:MAG TPA: tyrosine-type recombinase/integrase [bacterium]|jgi:site-specific recombinase XerD|nr:tyrosine-type recombinase/integrase [bacterium]
MSDQDGQTFNRPDQLHELEPYSGFLDLCKSVHTRSNYHQDLRVLKLFLDQAGLKPVDAKPQDLARFAGQLAKPGQTPAGKTRGAYSTRSLKRILASTRSFYRYLASVQQITNDPTAVFHNLAIRSPQRNPHPLAPKDREALVRGLQTSDLEGQKVSLVVLLGFHCGLRVSEIAHLKVRDVDLNQSHVTVIGKGDKERIVPMTESLKLLMTQYLAAEKAISPYLFPSPRDTNKPIHPHFLELWVKKAAQWAKFENPDELTVHVLRHSFGTQLAESGASVYEIRDLMGHSSIMVSENYVKLASTRGRQAHQKAFGANLQVHALNLGALFGIESVLKRHRARIQKAQDAGQ